MMRPHSAAPTIKSTGVVGTRLGPDWGQTGANMGPTWGQHGANMGPTWGDCPEAQQDRPADQEESGRMMED